MTLADQAQQAGDLLLKFAKSEELSGIVDDRKLPFSKREAVDSAQMACLKGSAFLLQCAAALREREGAQQAGQVPQDEPTCERCGVEQSRHSDAAHWCDNQSFAREDGSVVLGAAPEAPAQPEQGERTATDYAIEHAEYMAQSAEQLVAAVNDLAKAEQERDDGQAEDSDVHAAQETLSESVRSTRSAIYEFRKRRDRAALAAAPQRKPCLVDGACKHGNWCSDTYCQEHCRFTKPAQPDITGEGNDKG